MAGADLAAEIKTVSLGRQEPEGVSLFGRRGAKELFSHLFLLSFTPQRQAQTAGSRGFGIARRHGSSAGVLLRQKASPAMFPKRSRVCIDPASAVPGQGASQCR